MKHYFTRLLLASSLGGAAMSAIPCSCKNKCALSVLNAADQGAATEFCQGLSLSPVTDLTQLPSFAGACADFKDFSAQVGHACACFQKLSASASSTCSYLTPTAGGTTCAATTATVYMTSTASCSASATLSSVPTSCPSAATITETSTAISIISSVATLVSASTVTATPSPIVSTTIVNSVTTETVTAAATVATTTATPQHVSCLRPIQNGNFEEGPSDSDQFSDRLHPWVTYTNSQQPYYDIRPAPGQGRGGSNAPGITFNLDTAPGPASQYSIGIEQYVTACYDQPGAGYSVAGYFKTNDASVGLVVDLSGCQRLGPCETTTLTPTLGAPDADGYRYFETAVWAPRSGLANLPMLITLRSRVAAGAGLEVYEIFLDDIVTKTYRYDGSLISSA
ncbi:hypothetical protein PG993_010567 [Apiospora rasikravindrae]|uniref:Uncharacterized protein n=1 Tax=Apiospora rasikravindrae TaxID=990691 RepID=A0ABR1SN03_9PEZI